MEATIDGVKFTNVPDKRYGTKINDILTQSNVQMSQSVADYLNSNAFYALVNGVDIDWNGVEVAEGTVLNTTADLIKWIKGLASSGTEQIQADWNQTDTSKKDYIKNKPTIPQGVTVDSQLSDSSTNPVQNKVVKQAIDNKQDKLNSGQNVKTINGQSILGNGNIEIQGGGNVTVDSSLSETSTNPVQNKAVKAAIDSLNNELERKSDTNDVETLQEKVDTLEQAGYITRAVNDLVNYYRKSETYTQAEINAMMATVQDFEPVIGKLPTSGEAMKIYFVPAADNASYTEYLWNSVTSEFVPLATHSGDIGSLITQEIKKGDNMKTPSGDAVFSFTKKLFLDLLSVENLLQPTNIISNKLLNTTGELANYEGYSVKVYNVTELNAEDYVIRKGGTPGIASLVSAAIWCVNADGSGIVKVEPFTSDYVSYYTKPDGADYLLCTSHEGRLVDTAYVYDSTFVRSSSSIRRAENKLCEVVNNASEKGNAETPIKIISNAYINVNGTFTNQSNYSIKVYDVRRFLNGEYIRKTGSTPGYSNLVSDAMWCEEINGYNIIKIEPFTNSTDYILEKPFGANYLFISSYDSEVIHAARIYKNKAINTAFLKSQISNLTLSLSEKSEAIQPINTISDKLLNTTGELANYEGYSVKVYNVTELQESYIIYRSGKTPGIASLVCAAIWCTNADGSGIVKVEPFTSDYVSYYTKPDGAKYLMCTSFDSRNAEKAVVYGSQLIVSSTRCVIDCYGDSLTRAGVYENALLVNLRQKGFVNAIINNRGVDGQKTSAILKRYGSVPIVIKEKFAIPPTTTGVIITTYTPIEVGTNANIDPNTDYASVNPVCIRGVYGNLSNESRNNNDFTYTFTRLEAGDSVLVNSGSIVHPYPRHSEKPDVTIFYCGTNDAINIDADVLIENIDRATKMVANGQYIVVGLHKERTEYGLDYTIDDVKAFNAKLLKKFASKYVDVLSYMNQCSLEDAGITPTTEDTERIAEGKCPMSITSDGLHFTTVGYTLLGNLIFNAIVDNGYI